jgi:hypothetical protein
MQEIDQILQEFNSQKKLSQVCNDFFNFLKGDFIDTTDTINYQKQNYNYTIVRQIKTIEEDENSNLQTYIIASFDLGKVEKIPNKTFLANLSRSVYEKYIFVPFVIVFRYRVNEQNYLTFSISQIRDKTNQRTGKTKTTKVILLKDINLEKPHPAHSKILEKLKNETTTVKNFDELHENWLKVLNIKELGDEFYKKILEKYNNLVEKIMLPTHTNPSENDKKDFALRLVGRLIFCWFLKAKGWIGEDILSSKIVDVEFIRQNEISFYHQILELLFFESLNKDQKDRDFENKEKFASVPYLNGGLFEAGNNDFYNKNEKQPDKRTNWKLEIPNQNLKEIFELFESYYFTIDENTSTEQEIGVDPEMMGRIFENFILNRSSTGSFYTPREIVDYMVETSLKECLKTENLPENVIENLFDTKYWTPTEQFKKDFGQNILEKLNELKILDPACGSGAFPMGVLQKLTEIIHTLEPKNKDGKLLTLYEIKLNILQNSIYGVDLLPIAVEISRLRCWLSLVVDEETPVQLELQEIAELKNILQQLD